MAAQETPAAMADLQHQGSLMTLFLFNPTVAFFYVCNLDDVSTFCTLFGNVIILGVKIRFECVATRAVSSRGGGA